MHRAGLLHFGAGRSSFPDGHSSRSTCEQRPQGSDERFDKAAIKKGRRTGPVGETSGLVRRARTACRFPAQCDNLQIIEVECYPALGSDAPTLRALAPERVWLIGSRSKTVSAALRFGHVVCLTGLREVGGLAAQHSLLALSRADSALCLVRFCSGAAAPIRGRVGAEYSERLQIVINWLGAFDWGWQVGLALVWLRLPTGWRASTFARKAEAAGLLLRQADQYALGQGRAPNAVQLAVTGAGSRAQLDGGIEGLAQLLTRPPTDITV